MLKYDATVYVQCDFVMVRPKVHYVHRPLGVSIFSNVAPFEKSLNTKQGWPNHAHLKLLFPQLDLFIMVDLDSVYVFLGNRSALGDAEGIHDGEHLGRTTFPPHLNTNGRREKCVTSFEAGV